MSKVSELKVSVSFAWWWKPYCYGVLATCWLTQRMPDSERLAYWCKRAIRMRYVDPGTDSGTGTDSTSRHDTDLNA